MQNIKGQIVVHKHWYDYDAHMVYIMFLASRFEINAMFKEIFKR